MQRISQAPRLRYAISLTFGEVLLSIYRVGDGLQGGSPMPAAGALLLCRFRGNR